MDPIKREKASIKKNKIALALITSVFLFILIMAPLAAVALAIPFVATITALFMNIKCGEAFIQGPKAYQEFVKQIKTYNHNCGTTYAAGLPYPIFEEND